MKGPGCDCILALPFVSMALDNAPPPLRRSVFSPTQRPGGSNTLDAERLGYVRSARYCQELWIVA
jgi:hypothetical protein